MTSEEQQVLAERARCAAVCRAVAAALNDDTALACADAIERGPVATLTTERNAWHAALAAAVREEREAADALPNASLDNYAAAERALADARAAADAALAAAGGV